MTELVGFLAAAVPRRAVTIDCALAVKNEAIPGVLG